MNLSEEVSVDCTLGSLCVIQKSDSSFWCSLTIFKPFPFFFLSALHVGKLMKKNGAFSFGAGSSTMGRNPQLGSISKTTTTKKNKNPPSQSPFPALQAILDLHVICFVQKAPFIWVIISSYPLGAYMAARVLTSNQILGGGVHTVIAECPPHLASSENLMEV